MTQVLDLTDRRAVIFLSKSKEIKESCLFVFIDMYLLSFNSLQNHILIHLRKHQTVKGIHSPKEK